MKKKVLFLPLALTIVGCPGEKITIPEQRSVMINENHLCFSVDKHDVLNRYVVSSTQKGKYKEFAAADLKSFSYPESCIEIALPAGYAYEVSYTLNERDYYYPFFKDNDGRIMSYH